MTNPLFRISTYYATRYNLTDSIEQHSTSVFVHYQPLRHILAQLRLIQQRGQRLLILHVPEIKLPGQDMISQEFLRV